MQAFQSHRAEFLAFRTVCELLSRTDNYLRRLQSDPTNKFQPSI